MFHIIEEYFVNCSYYCIVIMASGESKMSQSTGSQQLSKSYILCAESVTNMRKHVFEFIYCTYGIHDRHVSHARKLGSILHLKKIHSDVHPADAYQFQNVYDCVGRVLSSLHKLS